MASRQSILLSLIQLAEEHTLYQLSSLVEQLFKSNTKQITANQFKILTEYGAIAD
jgi:hypothetical protein